MSTGTITIEALEGIDLENTPPCDCCTVDPWIGTIMVRCSMPAVARVTTSCDAFHTELCFMCEEDLAALKQDGLFCHECLPALTFLAYTGES